jgi:hypothetical protein
MSALQIPVLGARRDPLQRASGLARKRFGMAGSDFSQGADGDAAAGGVGVRPRDFQQPFGDRGRRIAQGRQGGQAGASHSKVAIPGHLQQDLRGLRLVGRELPQTMGRHLAHLRPRISGREAAEQRLQLGEGVTALHQQAGGPPADVAGLAGQRFHQGRQQAGARRGEAGAREGRAPTRVGAVAAQGATEQCVDLGRPRADLREGVRRRARNRDDGIPQGFLEGVEENHRRRVAGGAPARAGALAGVGARESLEDGVTHTRVQRSARGSPSPLRDAKPSSSSFSRWQQTEWPAAAWRDSG